MTEALWRTEKATTGERFVTLMKALSDTKVVKDNTSIKKIS